MIKYTIKVALAILGVTAFVVALVTFFNLITNISFVGVIADVLTVIGAFMPWHPSSWNALMFAITAAITVRVAMFVWRVLNIFNAQT
ncbi:hypothetical protein FWH13_02130 [Candidatus Saccharibacteria bacterium]|nr:hypothetical protein [Candidatus Saccharibacteria bacterium]